MMKTTRHLLPLLLLTTAAAFGGEIDDVLAKAKEGDMPAQLKAAEMYAGGKGVAKNLKEALEWYRKAAEQGNADAQLALGKLHIGGGGVPKDSTEAAKWFLLAAHQGRAVAQVQMARMHLAGAGTMKDNVEAYRWARLAAAQGDKQAKPIIAFLTTRMTPAQIAEAETMIREEKEAKPGDGTMEGVPPIAPPLE